MTSYPQTWDSIPPQSGATAVPAAGASPATVSNSPGKRNQLIAVTATLTSAVAVANRIVHIDVTVDGRVISYYSGYTQTASQVTKYTFLAIGQVIVVIVNANYLCPFGIPPVMRGFPDKWVIVTDNIQAADQWTAATYVFKED